MKIFDKVKKFYNEHKTGCRIAIGVVVVTATGLIIRYFNNHEDAEEDLTLMTDLDYDESSNDDEVTDIWSKRWDERYRESYNLVHNFAKTINLEVGEEYIIGNYYDSEGKQENVVSHLVDGDAAYPPEEADED